jgi:hypothetical protein
MRGSTSVRLAQGPESQERQEWPEGALRILRAQKARAARIAREREDGRRGRGCRRHHHRILRARPIDPPKNSRPCDNSRLPPPKNVAGRVRRCDPSILAHISDAGQAPKRFPNISAVGGRFYLKRELKPSSYHLFLVFFLNCAATTSTLSNLASEMLVHFVTDEPWKIPAIRAMLRHRVVPQLLGGGDTEISTKGVLMVDADLRKVVRVEQIKLVLRDLSCPSERLFATARPPVSLGCLVAMNAGDGAITERRTRINRPDDGSARCRGSRVGDQPNDFCPSTLLPTTPSTSSVTSSQRRHTGHSEPRPCRRGAR